MVFVTVVFEGGKEQIKGQLRPNPPYSYVPCPAGYDQARPTDNNNNNNIRIGIAQVCEMTSEAQPGQ